MCFTVGQIGVSVPLLTLRTLMTWGKLLIYKMGLVWFVPNRVVEELNELVCVSSSQW